MKKVLLFIMMTFVFGICNVSAAISGMPSGSYIIGDHLFTRTTSDEYNGQLSTDAIMEASKTFDDANDSMIIYYKTPRGNLINALTGEIVDLFESDLMENIKYYNLKEIPEYGLTTYAVNPNDTSQTFNIFLNHKYNDSNEDNNLMIRWDVYGAADWNGNLYDYGNEIVDDETLTLLGSAHELTDNYTFVLDLDSHYSYVGYPYIEDGDNKIYLDPTDGLTVYSGATIDASIVDNEMVVSLNGISDYVITSVQMYADHDDTVPHINLQDLLAITQGDDRFDNLTYSYVKLLEEISKVSADDNLTAPISENHYYPAEVYIDSDPSKTTVTIGDVGNSEREEHEYYLVVNVYSSTLDCNITVSNPYNPIVGTVYQPVLPDSEGEVTELGLIDYIGFISAFIEAFQNIDPSELFNFGS